MHEIEPGTIVDTRPQRVRANLTHFVPSHMRHFETCAVRAGHAFGGKPDHVPGKDAKARHIALGTVFEQHLLTDADPKEWFVACRIQDCLTQIA